MQYLLSLAVLSLFLPIRLKTGLVLLRPFEVLTLFALVAVSLSGRWRQIVVPIGLWLLAPSLIWHVLSAATAGVGNAMREALQVGVVALFAFLLAQSLPAMKIREITRIIAWTMSAILAYTIVWHLAHGYWVAWKQLGDTRLAFVFLPVALAGLILFAEPAQLRRLWPLWWALLPLLLMSGERKALLIHLFLTVLLFARGRLVPLATGAIVGFVALFTLSTLVDDPYLQTQIRSVIDPASTGNYEYVIATGQYMPGDSLSNTQRAFAFAISNQMIADHPLIGVGTNQYVAIVRNWFPTLPEGMLLGIHGEFQRVLTENGAIGLGLYLMIWILSWLRLARILRDAVQANRLTARQARILPLLLFVPCALFVGTEAPGTRAFVVLIAIALAPDIARATFTRPAT